MNPADHKHVAREGDRDQLPIAVGYEVAGRLTALVDGLLSLRYGHADLVGRPCQIAHQVARVLQRRGWDGSPTRCPPGRSRRW